jgi:hypothetical protein
VYEHQTHTRQIQKQVFRKRTICGKRCPFKKKESRRRERKAEKKIKYEGEELGLLLISEVEEYDLG